MMMEVSSPPEYARTTFFTLLIGWTLLLDAETAEIRRERRGKGIATAALESHRRAVPVAAPIFSALSASLPFPALIPLLWSVGVRTMAVSSQHRFSGQVWQSTMSLSRKRSRRVAWKPSASKNDVRRV